MGWRDGAVAESTGCSSLKLRLSIYQPYGGLQPSIFISGVVEPFSSLWGHQTQMWYTDIHTGKIPIHIKCLKMKRNVLCRSNWTALGHVIWSDSAAPVVDFWTQWLCFLPCSDEQMPPNCRTLVLMVWRANVSTHIDYENNGFLLIISPRAARRESWLVLTKQKSPLALSAPLFLSKIIWLSQRWLILCQDPSPHTHHGSWNIRAWKTKSLSFQDSNYSCISLTLFLP